MTQPKVKAKASVKNIIKIAIGELKRKRKRKTRRRGTKKQQQMEQSQFQTQGNEKVRASGVTPDSYLQLGRQFRDVQVGQRQFLEETDARIRKARIEQEQELERVKRKIHGRLERELYNEELQRQGLEHDLLSKMRPVAQLAKETAKNLEKATEGWILGGYKPPKDISEGLEATLTTMARSKPPPKPPVLLQGQGIGQVPSQKPPPQPQSSKGKGGLVITSKTTKKQLRDLALELGITQVRKQGEGSNSGVTFSLNKSGWANPNREDFIREIRLKYPQQQMTKTVRASLESGTPLPQTQEEDILTGGGGGAVPTKPKGKPKKDSSSEEEESEEYDEESEEEGLGTTIV